MGSVSKIRKLGDQSRALNDVLPTFRDIACFETATELPQIPHCVDGRLMPVIDSVLPLSKASEVHRRMESNLNVGKIVLTIADPIRSNEEEGSRQFQRRRACPDKERLPLVGRTS
jgi:hypothetical protein